MAVAHDEVLRRLPRVQGQVTRIRKRHGTAASAELLRCRQPLRPEPVMGPSTILVVDDEPHASI